MHFDPFEVSTPHIIYAALGGFVVFFGMFSLFIREKLYIGEACWAFLFGVVIGPYGANIFNPRAWGGGDNEEVTNTIVLEVTRVVLAIGVFAIGVELPKAYMARHWKSLLFLLGPGMTWGWFVSAALIYALIPGLTFLSSLAIAACLTPTDPILAAAVVGGKYADKHVPAHLRHLLAAESGCNDGAAYPFLFISLYLIIDSSTGQAISDWFLLLWLYQVVLGIVLGALIGYGFRHLMKFCESKDLIDRQSYVAQYVSLAMLTIGTTTLLGSDDLLAAFSCGTAFAWDGFFNKQTEQAVFSSVIDLLFNIAAFVFVGAWMPFSSFADAQLSLSVWRLIVIAILVLLLRRLPIMIMMYKWIPDVKTFREAIFSGHFGPMGIGAIYISTLAAERLPPPQSPPQGQTQLLASTIQPIVAFMVLASIATHGLSIPFFSLGRQVHSISRTWSRHDTLGRHSLPEWANQTRRVVRAEDIVINRDHLDLEKGESPVALTEDEKTALGDMSRRESTTVHGGSTDAEKDAGSGSSQTQTPDNRTIDTRDEVPPDGTETTQEWREGEHRIIERRSGPGEEVEVEVQKHHYGPSETDISTFRVAEDTVNDTVQEIRHKLSEGFAQAAEGIQQEASKAEHKLKENLSPQSSHTSRPPPTRRESHNQDEEEEGWMSDRSDGEADESDAGEPSSPTRESGRRGKSPKPHRSPKLSVITGRRRHSFRRGVLSPRHFSPTHPATEDTTPSPSLLDVSSSPSTPRSAPLPSRSEDETNESRGRRMTHNHARESSSTASSIKSPTLASHRSLRHARLETLRSPPGSRDLSPARSVRWADEHSPSASRPGSVHGRSGTTTPRGIWSPNSSIPGTPLAGSEDEGDGGPSARGSVISPNTTTTTTTEQRDGPIGGSGNGNPREKDSPQSMVRFELPLPVPGGKS